MNKESFDVDMEELSNFMPPLNKKELLENAMRLKDSISLKEGLQLAEKNPRLFVVAMALAESIERVAEAKQATNETVKELTGNDSMPGVSRKTMTVVAVALAAHLINQYSTAEFIIE